MILSSPVFWALVGVAVADLAIGWLLGRRMSASAAGKSDRRLAEALRGASRRLSEAVAGVQSEVEQHHQRIQSASRMLASADGDDSQVARSVLASVAEILQHNAKLQDRLGEAEGQLREQARQLDAWMSEARTDPLTGLPNRRAFQDALAHRIAEWQRNRVPFCLMLIDIDHFKRVNDEHGHPAGDFVLRAVADFLEYTVRRMDLIARIGGEEFAVLLPDTAREQGCRAAERIRTAVAQHEFHMQDTRLRLTLSLGLSLMGEEDDAATLTERTDQALYASKSGGRNCAHFHDGERCHRVEQRPESEPLPDEAESPSGVSAELSQACTALRGHLESWTAER